MSKYQDKFQAGDQFRSKITGKVGKVVKRAAIDEFGADFYFAEENYVVEIEGNASYNFPLRNGKVMTRSDMDKVTGATED